MRELTYAARRTVEWREAPDPRVQAAGEAIVAPVAATSCDVDSVILAGHATRRQPHMRHSIDPLFALGHECAARVVDAGDAVTGVAVARALGASDVLYVDPDPAHRPLAETYGARTAEEFDPIPHGFDLAVAATGRVGQLALAVRRARGTRRFGGVSGRVCRRRDLARSRP